MTDRVDLTVESDMGIRQSRLRIRPCAVPVGSHDCGSGKPMPISHFAIDPQDDVASAGDDGARFVDASGLGRDAEFCRIRTRACIAIVKGREAQAGLSCEEHSADHHPLGVAWHASVSKTVVASDLNPEIVAVFRV